MTANKIIQGDFGSGGNNMEARVAKLEASMSHVETDIRDIKQDIREIRDHARTDFRLVFAAIIAATLGLAGLMAHGFKWL